MASYVITYDLNKAGQNYEALEKAIKSYNAWAKIATTTFVIRSDNSSNGIRDHLKAQMDANDELFVGKPWRFPCRAARAAGRTIHKARWPEHWRCAIG